jgi:hypothetical protein
VLDASQVKAGIRALTLDWNAGPGSQVVQVRVEGSNDLQSWTPWATAPVVRIQNESQTLLQPRIEFPVREAKYLKLTGQGAEFVLKEVRAEVEPVLRGPQRSLQTAAGTPGAKAGEYLFDLGARLPVETVRLVLGEANAVVSAGLYMRDDDKQPWQPVFSAPFYRLQQDGRDVQSPAIHVSRRPARYWMARMATGSSSGAPPMIEVGWRPAQVVFVAGGQGPYSVAFGNPSLPAAALPVQTLIPNHDRLAELKLPEAKVGVVVAGPEPTQMEKLVSDTNPRRILLWGVLLAGVGLLGFMSWRLSKQMK